jgi:chemotaxis protein MotB
MAANSVPEPIIIVKRRKSGHGGHHGGAWKVAYADFVTAMMALFIVLWLTTSSDEVKKAVGGYFVDPSGVGKSVGTDLAGSGEGLMLRQEDMQKLQSKIEQAFKKVPEFQKQLKNQVQMTVTGEGLRIEFLETEDGLFFQSGSPSPTPGGTSMLTSLAHEVAKVQSGLMIEGHTDSKPFAGTRNYTNWELSADRANAARRIMQTAGVRPDQVSQIRGYADHRGYADQKPLTPGHPEGPSNRRISIVVRYSKLDPASVPLPAPAKH